MCLVLTGNPGSIRERGTTGEAGGDVSKLTRRLLENISDDQIARRIQTFIPVTYS
jgi:hypothetical protein